VHFPQFAVLHCSGIKLGSQRPRLFARCGRKALRTWSQTHGVCPLYQKFAGFKTFVLEIAQMTIIGLLFSWALAVALIVFEFQTIGADRVRFTFVINSCADLVGQGTGERVCSLLYVQHKQRKQSVCLRLSGA
jgi:hypothetical protein